MSFSEAITRWRALPEGEQQRRRWDAIPIQVAESMAFEGEPVDLEWLKTLHQVTAPPAGSKPAVQLAPNDPVRHGAYLAALRSSDSGDYEPLAMIWRQRIAQS